MYTWVALSCERLVSRFSISIFQEHVPIQCHYERMFISHRRSENSPVTRQKSSAKCLVALITIVLFRRVEEFFKLLFCNDFFTPATIIGDENSA